MHCKYLISNVLKSVNVHYEKCCIIVIYVCNENEITC